MNNQLRLPLVRLYSDLLTANRPIERTALQEAIKRIKRFLRRFDGVVGQNHSSLETGRVYWEYSLRQPRAR